MNLLPIDCMLMGFLMIGSPFIFFVVFVLDFGWAERCCHNIDGQYCSAKILSHAWTPTIEVAIPT